MKEALKLALEAWKNAAIRLGEELSSVGPDGYYDMTAQQWLDWAMEQEPRGKNSLAQPEQEPVAQLECAYGYSQCKALEISQKKRSWVGLTDEEVNWFGWHGTSIRTIEAELKEKNT